jgi:hypothetical protein
MPEVVALFSFLALVYEIGTESAGKSRCKACRFV